MIVIVLIVLIVFHIELCLKPNVEINAMKFTVFANNPINARVVTVFTNFS